VKTTAPFTSTQQFPNAYVVNGTWVSGTPADVSFPLLFSGTTFFLTVHQAVITFDHTKSTHAANGIISGVLHTAELLNVITTFAGEAGICSPSTLAPILAEIKQAQDILSDGSNPPGVPCDAISIGIGFTADAIGQPTTSVNVCPPADKCMEAGAGGCEAGVPGDAAGGG
jgi:hypothetical protein